MNVADDSGTAGSASPNLAPGFALTLVLLGWVFAGMDYTIYSYALPLILSDLNISIPTLSIVPLLLTWLEHRLKVVEHKQARPIPPMPSTTTSLRRSSTTHSRSVAGSSARPTNPM